MKVVIKYHYRLGDIIRCFPIAKHFANRGDTVEIECNPNYHSIFKAVSYVKPCLPGTIHDGALVFDPQVWPARYEDFRKSGLLWAEYVYSLYREWRGMDRTIDFDQIDAAAPKKGAYGLPEGYSLLFPFSMSSQPVSLPCFFRLAGERMDLDKAYLFMSEEQRSELQARGLEPSRMKTVTSLAHLPALIRDAAEVMTVNTATTIIASAVRKHYFHIVEPNNQDNWASPNQTPIKL